MGFVVKNTTKWGLLDLLCPHSCRGCGVLGAVLCERCKNHIISEHQNICPHCRRVSPNVNPKSRQGSIPSGSSNLCPDCDSPFQDFWSVGWREGALAKLVSEYKYKSVRACSDTLAELLDRSIPDSAPKDMIIIPLPTIGKHIRERGLDHTNLLAKKLAKRRGWKVLPVLQRATDTVQVGTSAKIRQSQAEKTYQASRQVAQDSSYLLLDDVWTTGASMLSAAKVLKSAGAKTIYGAVIEIGKASPSEVSETPEDPEASPTPASS